MAKTHLRPHSFVISAALGLSLVCAVALSIRAQTAEDLIAKLSPTLSPDDAAISKLLIRGYTAYAKKDAPAILSLFSEQSPHFPAFKQFLEEDFAANEKARIDGLSALLVRNVQIQ